MKVLRTAGMAALASAAGVTTLALLPPKVSVEGLPHGFAEKQFDTGEVVLNYVEGPDNGPPLLLIPGQMESWQGYKLVLPGLARRFHVFCADVRGHGKSSRTPGRYSYNIVGNDLKQFLEGVVKAPAVVSGLSSGGVLAVWLAAYAHEQVRAIICEDPPIFSSIWPRIVQEKYMTSLFQNPVETLGGPGPRDLEALFMRMGIPKQGQEELLLIPAPLARGIVRLFKFSRALHPARPYDVPFLPYALRAGFKFYLEYDVDFSAATIDGRLSAGFDPEDALRKVTCPMLLLKATSFRHATWGLIGALDEEDVQRIRHLVQNLRVAEIKSGHEVHIGKPQIYLEEVFRFVDGLSAGPGGAARV